MEDFKVEGKKFIPEINFEAVTGNLTISGKSFHENTGEFYEPVMEWLRKYAKSTDQKITLNFKLTYFNTPSSKVFLDMVRVLEEYKGKSIINWYYPYEDEDLLEDGQNLKESTKLTMNMIAY